MITSEYISARAAAREERQQNLESMFGIDDHDAKVRVEPVRQTAIDVAYQSTLLGSATTQMLRALAVAQLSQLRSGDGFSVGNVGLGVIIESFSDSDPHYVDSKVFVELARSVLSEKVKIETDMSAAAGVLGFVRRQALSEDRRDGWRFLQGATQHASQDTRLDSVFRLRLTAPIKALIRLKELWELNDDQMNTLLGYTTQTGKPLPANSGNWRDVAMLRRPLDNSMDRVERVRMLTRIDGLLYGLYDNVEGPRKWLHHHLDDLQTTPLQYMLQGTLRHLYVVADYLQGLTDHSSSAS